ncbi:MAG: hypothetical protein WHT09_15370 [Thermogutta sp.]
MCSLTLYPSNWLYNAGVIGLLRVLESVRKDLVLLSDDGAIKGIENEIVDLLEKHTNVPRESPLDKLCDWHWHYVKTSFEWNYGSISDLVRDILRRAEHSTNRSQFKKQLQHKDSKSKDIQIAYEDQTIDFSYINEKIEEVWRHTFGRNSQYTVEEAISKLIEVIKPKKYAYIYRKAVGYLFSQGGFYQNLYNPNWFGDLKKFIEFFTSAKVFNSISSSTSVCGFCSQSKFKVEPVDATRMSFLFPVFSKFPNAYWQNNETLATQICSLCKFIIVHHHLALTRLSDGSEIFINAPSFQVMWYLNKFAREVLGPASSEEMRSKRNILAMSVIEYATKIQATLGVWTGMNIEVVSKRGGEIEFFSLPYEVIQLLADRRIASLLSQIGEFSVLNLVLAQDFSRLLELGYRLLRIGLKTVGEWGKSERDFVNQTLRLEKNKQHPARVADQLFQLSALIEEKRQRRETYERSCIF